MTHGTEVRTRVAQGIFLSAAVGDALGWPQESRSHIVGGKQTRESAALRAEFRAWTRWAGLYAGRYHDDVRSGEYSDDTQLLLAVARCCLVGDNWWERLTQVELPAWRQYQRGGGGSLLSAAAAWADGRPPWETGKTQQVQKAVERYRNAGGNGAVMRIAPHAVWADNEHELVARVLRDGLATHGHPRALVGSLAYAFALRDVATSSGTYPYGAAVTAARKGLIAAENVLDALPSKWGTDQDVEAFSDAWESTNQEAVELLDIVADSLAQGAISNPDATLKRLGCADPNINGAGTVSAAAAIYLASRFAARPEHGLLTAAFFRNGDTDTVAALAAGLLGALHDWRWLGRLATEVQDAPYIKDLARRIAARRVEPAARPTGQDVRRELREALDGADASPEFPDGRRYRVEGFQIIDEGRVRRARLRIEDGQTVIVDQRMTSPPPEPVEVAIWDARGKQRRTGVATRTGKTAAAKVSVRWEDGSQELLNPKDPALQLAFEGTERLRWLLDPDSFNKQFRADPGSVFLAVLKESPKSLTGTKLQQVLADFGVDLVTAKAAWEQEKLNIKIHPHVATSGSNMAWSDEPVATYDHLRQLTPEEALRRLLKPAGLKPEEKLVIAEVIRSGFRQS